MQRANDIPEVTVSKTGAAIPVDDLRAAGIQPGDRVAFVRTTRGSLVVVPSLTSATGPSLRSVVGICLRPADTSADEDGSLLREVRYGESVL